MKNITAIVGAAAIALLIGVASPLAASAHAVLNVAQYRVAIGWQFEPSGGDDTYAGTSNAIQVFVDIPTAKNAIGTPVSDLNSDCTKPDFVVTVTVGSTTSSPFCPAPAYDPDTGNGRLDEYDYALTPTAVGTYTFHITGRIHGVAIDRTIASGSSTFDSVADSTSGDFPIAVPPVSALSTKIDAVDGRASIAQSAATSAQSSATAAIVVGGVGVVLALISGLAALVAVRRVRPAT